MREKKTRKNLLFIHKNIHSYSRRAQQREKGGFERGWHEKRAD